jgi:hypothetical protein
MAVIRSIGHALCRYCAGQGHRVTSSGRHVLCTGCDGRGYFRLGETQADSARLGCDDHQRFYDLGFVGRRIMAERARPLNRAALARLA